MTPRIERMKTRLHDMRHRRWIDITDKLEDYPDLNCEPESLRNALLMKRILEETPVVIGDDELIVGTRGVISKFMISLGGHSIVPDHGKVLRLGFEGIRREAREAMKSFATSNNHFGERALEESVIVAMDAAEAFVRRHAHAARRMASIEHHPQRKKELERIAEVCSNITSDHAKTFYEAVQMLWFSHFFICVAGVSAIGRVDQILGPYYERDIAAGELTRDEALELIECLWLKFQINAFDAAASGDTHQNISLGGQTADGRDASNEVTYLCLDAAAELRTADPKINVRLSKQSPSRLVRRTAEVLSLGFGLPAIYNDDTIIPGLELLGIPTEDARNYSNDGCWEPLVPGKSDLNFFQINLLRILEFTLNNGVSLVEANTQERPGLRTGTLEDYETFDDLMDAFKEQCAYTIDWLVEGQNKRDRGLFNAVSAGKVIGHPYNSATFDACIKRGRSIFQGGATYVMRPAYFGAVANVADALAALKRLVYEEGSVSKKEILEAIRNDFSGADGNSLKNRLINKSPKFGNDDDYVDNIAKEIVDYLVSIILKHKTYNGTPYAPGMCYFFYTQGAATTGASADGRRRGDPVANHFSPALGRDMRGPTASLKSVTKVDLSVMGQGAPFDVKFHPRTFSGEDGIEKLDAYIRTFIQMGGNIMQVNVVDRETLLEAQRHPDRYRNLVVRVWGFTGYFVELPREQQEHVIARTENEI